MRYLAIALPGVLVTLGLALVACAEIFGAHPLTMGPPRSVPEAIAMRDDAAAARMLEQGEDIHAVGVIRAGVLTDRPLLVTPLEAAVLVDATTMLDYLTASGAAVPEQLTCLAADAGARAVRAKLGDGTCHSGDALRDVLARP